MIGVVKLNGKEKLYELDQVGETTCCGKRPAVEDDLQRKTTFAGSLHAAYSALRHFFLNRSEFCQKLIGYVISELRRQKCV